MEVTQAEYARHRGVSRAYVTSLIKKELIPSAAWRWKKKKRMIDSLKADQALANNLNPAFTRKILPKSALDLELGKMDQGDIIKALDNGEISVNARRAIRELQELLDSPGNMSKKDRRELQETIECFEFALTADPDFIKKTTPWVIV